MMKKYEYLEHTADAKFRAFGTTLEEAFENAAEAMSNITADIEKIEPKIRKEFMLKSENLESLLYDFLEKIITETELEGFLLSKAFVKKIKKTPKGYIMFAELSGDTYRTGYSLKTEIKAITYNDMEIKKEKDNKYTIIAVVDI